MSEGVTEIVTAEPDTYVVPVGAVGVDEYELIAILPSDPME
ncbi:MAG: hypothetical protein P4L33_16665 [Capsulimonadaceae bacterium]|nr:hypothetical protein [Capsulimonadaceae bacterium]